MKSNGSLDAGEVVISLNGEDITLRPTINAARMVSRQYAGYAKARQLIVDENLDAVVFVIRVGSGMNDKDIKKLEERVWKNGLDIDLLIPLIKYIAILGNGGRPLPDDIDSDVFGVKDITNEDNQIEDYRSGNG